MRKKFSVVNISNIMKNAMYIHLEASLIMPFIVFKAANDGWGAAPVGLLYAAETIIVSLIGFIGALAIAAQGKKTSYSDMIESWKKLKFETVHFYIINFIYSLVVWFILIDASRGIFLFVVPIPIMITYFMILQSGIVGICCIMRIIKNSENAVKISKINYLFQIIPVLDVISTFYILKKCERAEEAAEL